MLPFCSSVTYRLQPTSTSSEAGRLVGSALITIYLLAIGVWFAALPPGVTISLHAFAPPLCEWRHTSSRRITAGCDRRPARHTLNLATVAAPWGSLGTIPVRGVMTDRVLSLLPECGNASSLSSGPPTSVRGG